MRSLLTLAASPHISSRANVTAAMRLVVMALIPAFLFSVYLFGWRVIVITLISVVSCVSAEALMQRLFGKKITIKDSSAVLTGLLLAFNLPPGVPWWMPVAGGLFAIVFVKQLFGGLGHNFINPALASRAFLVASWPSYMTKLWLAPHGGTISGIDTITSATPLSLLKNPVNYGDAAEIVTQLNSFSTVRNLFIGRTGGCIGETSTLLLLIGGLFLLATGIIDYRIVGGYLGSFVLLAIALPTRGNLMFHLFSGGLFLGVFFMATDWVTSPITKKGRWLFGIGCGILTIVIRIWGGYPEGVSYSILLMNVFTPLIDRLTRERVFGQPRRISEKK